MSAQRDKEFLLSGFGKSLVGEQSEVKFVSFADYHSTDSMPVDIPLTTWAGTVSPELANKAASYV